MSKLDQVDGQMYIRKKIVLGDDRSWCVPKQEDYSKSRVVGDITADPEGRRRLIALGFHYFKS